MGKGSTLAITLPSHVKRKESWAKDWALGKDC